MSKFPGKSKHCLFGATCALWLIGLSALADAQMIFTETPLQNVGSRFFENNGIGFNFSIPGSDRFVGIGPDGQPTSNGAINFNFGGMTTPPFGGFDPNAGARFGFGYRGGNGGGFGLNFNLGQGADSTFTQTTPSLMLPNGGTGSIFSGSQRPFVTGFIPIVGENAIGPQLAEPIAAPPRRRRSTTSSRPVAKRTSSATTADMSVSEIRRRKQYEREREIEALLEKARSAIADDKVALAKNHLRNAARRATGEKRAEILDELEQLIRDDP